MKNPSSPDELLTLIREQGFGKNSPDLEDAVRQVLQVAIIQASNARTAQARVNYLEKALQALANWEGDREPDPDWSKWARRILAGEGTF